MLKKYILIVWPLLLIEFAFAQSQYPTDYFRSPIEYPLGLAGNFGEIRPNHLHAGFDVKTNNKEGMPIYAVADGYLSRIKISPYGYGKALYISHSNGFTSVYAHLQSFNGPIGDFAKAVQASNEMFEIDTALSAPVIAVKKGDLIGLSGNTGGSMGPHLHFEIRDSQTEMPINPYFFGFKVKDNVKPIITKIAIFPIGEESTVNGKHDLKKFKPQHTKENYSLKNTDTITVNGDIGFGIECYDSETGSTNQNGVFSIELLAGGKRIYYHEIEKFTFENSRYVNTHIDYAEQKKHKDKIQKCFLSKNNQLGIYKDVVNNGILHFDDNEVHWIKYIVKDYVGNAAELTLKVKGTTKRITSQKATDAKPVIFDCLKNNEFSKEDIEINIPAYTLYDDLKLNYYRSPKKAGLFSMIHHVQDDATAVQKVYTIRIKPIDLPTSLENKAAIVSLSGKGIKNYIGGNYKNGWVTAQLKTLGDFAIAVDTTAPKLKPVFAVKENTTVDLSKARTIGVKVSDNLSGIKIYKATIDGKWVLTEFEAKQDLLFYTFDDKVTKGKHTFSIDVSDDKNNTTHWECTFIR